MKLKKIDRNTFRNFLGALAMIALIGVAGAVGTNAGDYAAPTQADLDRDTKTQLANLCNADGWPEDAADAYKRACQRELRRAN
jgi:hypothetical protein